MRLSLTLVGSWLPVENTCLTTDARQCLLDEYDVNKCASCGQDILSISSSGEQQILCNLINEGGLQRDLDILPILAEEGYLKAFPEERRCRAFLEFCREGDVEAVVDLLKASDDNGRDEDDSGDDESMRDSESDVPQPNAATVLRYQDPIGNMSSALHIAVLHAKIEVIWTLLLLATNLESQRFPQAVIQAMEQFGITREDQADKIDIRSLKDNNEMTAAQLAHGRIGHLFDTKLLDI